MAASNDGIAENAQTQQAYEYIRQRILDGTYASGRRLQTLVLADEIGLSRSPVRDALKQLKSEGLVDIRARLGASVRSFNTREFKEMNELRLALESFATELAARNRSADDVVEIQDAFEKMEQLVQKLEERPADESLVQELVNEDIRFHLGILKASGNNLMREEILRLHLLNRLVRLNLGDFTEGPAMSAQEAQERRRSVLACHKRIFQAILQREPEAARQAMYEHIADIIERSILALARIERKLSAKSKNQAAGLYATF